MQDGIETKVKISRFRMRKISNKMKMYFVGDPSFLEISLFIELKLKNDDVYTMRVPNIKLRLSPY